MNKILSTVLVLVLCLTMVAVAEQAPAATAEAEKVLSPTAGPLPTDTTAPTSKPSTDGGRAANTSSSTEADTQTVAPVETVAPATEPEAIVIADENVNAETAPEAEIEALIADIEANLASVIPADSEVYKAVADKELLSATIAKFEFDTSALTADGIFPMKVDAPANLKEGDKIFVVIGIKNVYGEFTYTLVEGTVVGGQMVFDLQPEVWQSMQGQSNTQMMFFA